MALAIPLYRRKELGAKGARARTARLMGVRYSMAFGKALNAAVARPQTWKKCE
jgi:hypothetical protein